MRLNLDDLPSDPALLHQLVRDMAALVEYRGGEIERLLQKTGPTLETNETTNQ